MSYIVPRNKPNKCQNCPFVDKITYDCTLMHEYDYFDFEAQYKNCPLVEIPTPHGRLGDLDALKAHYRYSEADSEDERVWMMNIRRAITNAPTVIEAEGET